jgi:anti-anti-sigma factor
VAEADDGVTVTTHADGDTVVVALRGEFDLRGVEDVHRAMGAVIEGRPAAVALDAGDLAFVDSAGLHTLVRARQQADAAGVPFVLARSSVALDQLIDLAGLRETFGSGSRA